MSNVGEITHKQSCSENKNISERLSQKYLDICTATEGKRTNYNKSMCSSVTNVHGEKNVIESEGKLCLECI